MDKIKKMLALFLVVVLTLGILPTQIANAADEKTKHTVTLADIENTKWKGNSGNSTFKITEGTGKKSVYITPEEGYTVDNVSVEPENGAEVTYYFGTGEVYVKNVTADITLTPVVKQKKVPANLEIQYEFLPSASKDESIPAARVEFTFIVTDENGAPVPGANVYFKSDETEVSYTYYRETDENGKATANYSYVAGDYVAYATFDKDGEYGIEQPIHIVEQEAPQYLPADSVTGSRTNENDGAIRNLTDERYEYFTEPLSDGEYFNYAAGEWKKVEGGEITGLAPGWYALRYGEYADYDNNTLYLYSDYGTVEIQVTSESRRVSIDLENSPNIVFEETELLASQGGTVYFHVKPYEGYRIVSWEVDKPTYIGTIDYDEEEGYLVITGVTSVISVRVLAEQVLPKETRNIVPEAESTTIAPETKNTTTVSETESTTTVSEPKSTTTVSDENSNSNQKAPKTGDSSEAFLPVILFLLSLSVIVVFLGRYREKL